MIRVRSFFPFFQTTNKENETKISNVAFICSRTSFDMSVVGSTDSAPAGEDCWTHTIKSHLAIIIRIIFDSSGPKGGKCNWMLNERNERRI